MSHRFINQLGEKDSLDDVYFVADKQLRANRTGSFYLQVRLTDRSGGLVAMLWNATDKINESFDVGDFVRVHGNVQLYNNNLQVILTKIFKVDADTVDKADFESLASAEIDKMATRLRESLRGIRNVHLRNLAESYLIDEDFMKAFCRAPAGIKNHHAYPGGLLEHVVSLSEVASLVASQYPKIDKDLLLLGVFLHDSGKIVELSFERELGYTDEGQLLGHLIQGIELLTVKIRATEQLTQEAFPSELALRLKHMILSHHGEYEFGSPKLPMTPEALVLHLLDNLDAKLHNFFQLLSEESPTESSWTAYNAALGRKLFKGKSGE